MSESDAHPGSGDWGARIEVQQTESGSEAGSGAISLFLYIGNEDGSPLVMDAAAASGQFTLNAGPSRPAISGTASKTPIGAWAVHMSGHSVSRPLVNYMGLRTPYLHNLTEAVKQGLYASLWQQHNSGATEYSLELPDVAEPRANVGVVQVTGRLPLALDVTFVSKSASRHTGDDSGKVKSLSGPNFSTKLAIAEATFHRRFAAAFGDLHDSGHLPEGTAAVAKAALSNMLGGMGYWHGHSLVQIREKRKGETRVVPMWDAPLFSATPSRSFFPRGFLWDEGFHQVGCDDLQAMLYLFQASTHYSIQDHYHLNAVVRFFLPPCSCWCDGGAPPSAAMSWPTGWT